MNIITAHQKELNELCKNYRVQSLYAFGSVLRQDFSAKSDIDFLVNFQKMELLEYSDNYFDFLFALEKIFNRKIDLITEKSLKNPYFIKKLNKTKQLIYEA